MGYTIEKLAPDNYYKCGNIWDMNKNPKRTKKWHDELISGNRITFVYVENDEYIGEGSLVLVSGDLGCTIENERIYLSRMVVKPEYRNRGIGGVLLDYLTEYAKSLGYKEMSLGVDIDSIGARWLYEKKGFTSIFRMGEDEGGKFVKLLKTL
ncbi:MAG: GNAT family N-acetyltransferase [Oscillospiraceae bacterium]|nr:GNAT family N-acetyltransferase [Oscillospiraceae bacterium]